MRSFTRDEHRTLKEELMRLRVCGRGPNDKLLQDISGVRTRYVFRRLV